MEDELSGGEQAKARILLVSGDRISLDSLGSLLESDGQAVAAVSTIEDASTRLQAESFNMVIADLDMPDGGGFQVLAETRIRQPDAIVIIVTGYGAIEMAIEAIKKGAYDYVTRPMIDDDVRLAVRRGLLQQRLALENAKLRRAVGGNAAPLPGRYMPVRLAAITSSGAEVITGRAVAAARTGDGPGGAPPAKVVNKRALSTGAAGKKTRSISLNGAGEGASLAEARRRLEMQSIMQALQVCDGRRQAAAAHLGINRITLYKKMRLYGLMRYGRGEPPGAMGQ